MAAAYYPRIESRSNSWRLQVVNLLRSQCLPLGRVLVRYAHKQNPLTDATIELRMIDHMIPLMQQADAPLEQYERLGLKR